MKLSDALFAAAAVALGHALQLSNGFYRPAALAWLTVALVCAGVGAAAPRSARNGRAAVIAILSLGIAWQLAELFRSPPGLYLNTRDLGPLRLGVAIEAGLIAAGMIPSLGLRAGWLPLLAAVHVVLGIWLIHVSPSPRIDVVTVTDAAWNALRHGASPYAITFKDIYGAGSSLYAPGSVVDGVVQFGYPYPPITLLLVIPGYAFGDFRYALLAAMAISALLIAYARPSYEAQLSAALLLTTPRILFVLEQGWSEPITLLLVTGTVFFMVRRPGRAASIAGLAMASKQYMVAGIPLMWRHLRQPVPPRWKPMAIALAVAAIVTLPFMLWSPRAFLDDLVMLQLREPFRRDALSYLSWMARNGWRPPSVLLTVGAMLLSIVLVAKRGDDTPASFAGGMAFIMLATFAFGKKAFCNYYFLVVGLFCCAIAASDMMANKRRTHEPPVRARP